MSHLPLELSRAGCFIRPTLARTRISRVTMPRPSLRTGRCGYHHPSYSPFWLHLPTAYAAAALSTTPMFTIIAYAREESQGIDSVAFYLFLFSPVMFGHSQGVTCHATSSSFSMIQTQPGSSVSSPSGDLRQASSPERVSMHLQEQKGAIPSSESSYAGSSS